MDDFGCFFGMYRGEVALADIETYWVAYCKVLGPTMGLAMDDAALVRVAQSFAMAATAAELVMAFPLDERGDEPAPVFVAGPAL